MPELAEVKLMTEFFNSCSKSRRFKSIKRSRECKVGTDLGLVPSDMDGFEIEAMARGKETILFLRGPESGEIRRLSVIYGMSGYWKMCSGIEKVPIHTHLLFESTDGYFICLVDVRRFAKWKWVDGWSQNRGPDPVFEFDDFKSNIEENSHKKIFDKPICELLMDQKYFNGIGNYLRAEILYRAGMNPWMPSRDAVKDGKMLALCRLIPIEAYKIGGGSIKDWKNPYGEQKITMSEWLTCYRKKESTVDGTGRRLWFDKKYKKDEIGIN